MPYFTALNVIFSITILKLSQGNIDKKKFKVIKKRQY